MADQTQLNKQADETGPTRTLWHRLLGKELELVLTPVGITVLTEVQVSSNPPKADILLLRRFGNTWTTEQLPFLPDGIRDSRASHILIEFKYRETIQEETFQQAVGYDYFYQQGQQLARSQVETFVFSAKTPQGATLQAFGYEQTETAGVYRSKMVLVRHVTLIILNQLSPTPYNAFVQCFASQRRVRRAAFQRLLADGQDAFSETLWDFLTGLQNHIQTKEGNMSDIISEDTGLTPEMVIETGRQIRKAVIARLTPEERLEGLTAETRQALFTSLPTEERKALIASLPTEERKALIASLPTEERKALIASLPTEERKALVASLPAEERKALVASLPLEERLAGLAAEDIGPLLAQIEAYLRAQNKGQK